MIVGLQSSGAYVSIAPNDGYVIEHAAVNLERDRASISGCFTRVRDTYDSQGNLLATSTESMREAYELIARAGVWLVTTHRSLGAC
jgi:hypothetical protein